MYKKIIVALSLEHQIADRALTAAKALADDGAEIIAVHVTEPLQGSVRVFISDEDLGKVQAATADMLAERLQGHTGITSVILEGKAGQALSDYAAKVSADCIVVGSHKPGLSDHLLGSTASRIARHAPCSVHVLR
ncbi:MAG: universal stress protein [Alphaproteobacteria bacterium]|nr:universal stress protein [Alphaproteobacteria bacterium SS10]